MKSNIQEQLGKRIQKLRKISGYSQDTFAEKINIATTTLSSIETGKAFMTSQTLEKICDILNVKPQELFTFSDKLHNEDMYTYVKNKLEILKNDNEKIKILYNIIKSMLD